DVALVPRPPRTLLCPYTTLFRSRLAADADGGAAEVALVLREALDGFHRELRHGLVEAREEQGLHPRVGLQQGLRGPQALAGHGRSEEHTSELQSRENLVCRLLLE